MLSNSVFPVLRHIHAWREPCGMWIRFQALGNWCGKLSHFQVSRDRCRKVKEIANRRACNFHKWTRKEFCPNRKAFMNSLKRKQIQLFQGEFAAQTRLSDAQADLDRREWDRRNADFVLYESGMQLQSQRMELYQANQLSDQTQREKS